MLDELEQQQWHHLDTEEKLLLRVASRHLTAEYWREIAQAFGGDGDQRFGTGDSFETLASRLLEMADDAPRASANSGARL